MKVKCDHRSKFSNLSKQRLLETDVFFRLVTSMGKRKNSESPWGIEPQTEPQRLHGEREIIVFPDNQNLQAEFAISSSYFDIWNKSVRDIKELFLIP